MGKAIYKDKSPKIESDAYLKLIVIMKAGFHINETFEEIITRKQREEAISGKVFWGYGGTVCHPLTQVIPFVEEAIQKYNAVPVLALTFTRSPFATSFRTAGHYSVNGKIWNPLPYGVIVTSSRYAIVCRSLRRVDRELNLSEYEVAVGPSKGKPLSVYFRHRVDKACAVFSEARTSTCKVLKINYVAEIVEPYAVCLR